MKKIGIIGRGFVGSAVEFGFSAQTGCDAEVRIYDKDPTKSIHTLEQTVNKSDFIFSIFESIVVYSIFVDSVGLRIFGINIGILEFDSLFISVITFDTFSK